MIEFLDRHISFKISGRLVRKDANTAQEFSATSAKHSKFPNRDSELQDIMEVNDPDSYTQIATANLEFEDSARNTNGIISPGHVYSNSI